MKLANAAICLDCDELVEVTVPACPSCTNRVFLPLTVGFSPLLDRQEIDSVRVAVQRAGCA